MCGCGSNIDYYPLIFTERYSINYNPPVIFDDEKPYGIPKRMIPIKGDTDYKGPKLSKKQKKQRRKK